MPPRVWTARSAAWKGGVGAEVLRRVRLARARQPRVVEPRRTPRDELRRVEPRKRVRERELDALVLPDRPAEDDPLARVLGRPAEGGAADPHRLVREQHALGVEAVEDVPEAVPLRADAIGDPDARSSMKSSFDGTAFRPSFSIGRTMRPRTTYSSPSRRANVVMRVVAVPASGSVTANATWRSPVTTRGSVRARSSSLPCFTTVFIPKIVR
jgi:hypothetical protein